MHLRIILVILFAASGLPFASAQSATQIVWQIGKFDQSPVEFLGRPSDAVTFRVGISDPAKDWPGRQRTGDAYKILFPLDSVAGHYSLKIAALIDRPRVPVFDINVNGHSGTFYLHPKLSYSRSDFSYAFDPHESQSALDIVVPSSFLKEGENAIVLTCIDQPATPAGDKEMAAESATMRSDLSGPPASPRMTN